MMMFGCLFDEIYITQSEPAFSRCRSHKACPRWRL